MLTGRCSRRSNTWGNSWPPFPPLPRGVRGLQGALPPCPGMRCTPKAPHPRAKCAPTPPSETGARTTQATAARPARTVLLAACIPHLSSRTAPPPRAQSRSPAPSCCFLPLVSGAPGLRAEQTHSSKRRAAYRQESTSHSLDKARGQGEHARAWPGGPEPVTGKVQASLVIEAAAWSLALLSAVQRRRTCRSARLVNMSARHSVLRPRADAAAACGRPRQGRAQQGRQGQAAPAHPELQGEKDDAALRAAAGQLAGRQVRGRFPAPQGSEHARAQLPANAQVLKALGAGSYGKVYKVQRETDEQSYALKVRRGRWCSALAAGSGLAGGIHNRGPTPAGTAQETELGALSQPERNDAVNEIRLLVSINHPNVVRAAQRRVACTLSNEEPGRHQRKWIPRCAHRRSATTRRSCTAASSAWSWSTRPLATCATTSPRPAACSRRSQRRPSGGSSCSCARACRRCTPAPSSTATSRCASEGEVPPGLLTQSGEGRRA